MSDVQELWQADLQAIYETLASWPSNGKPVFTDHVRDAALLGFVEERDVEKPCRECGRPSHDYSYMKITTAGRVFMAAMEGKSHAR